MKDHNCKSEGIPVKLDLKGKNVVVRYICWKCGNEYTENLDFNNRNKWIPSIKDKIFKCIRCGNSNTNWIYNDLKFLKIDPSKVELSDLLYYYIMFDCNCGKKNKRKIRRELWHHLNIE